MLNCTKTYREPEHWRKSQKRTQPRCRSKCRAGQCLFTLVVRHILVALNHPFLYVLVETLDRNSPSTYRF